MGSRLACLALFSLTAACELPFPEPDTETKTEDVSETPASTYTPMPDAGISTAPVTVSSAPALTWFERASVVTLNGARAAPRQFRDRYMVFGDATLPNVFDGNPPSRPPLHYSDAIAEAARFHADDRMACFDDDVNPHSLCDGTSFWGWTADWGPPTISSGVAHPWLRPIHRSQPLWFTSSFICDGLLRSDGKVFGCVSDTSEAAGHRKILVLVATETQIGAGYATGGSFGFYSGETSRAAVPAGSPIVTAGHFFDDDKIVFAANVEAGAPPRSVTLVVGGVKKPLAVDLGTAVRGMYAMTETAGTACRTYHFELVDADGKSWRHPATGGYATSGEGGCSQDLVP
jgi:hypothetical protein